MPFLLRFLLKSSSYIAPYGTFATFRPRSRGLAGKLNYCGVKDYAKAQAVRTMIQRDFDAVFKEVDLLVSPVMPTPAFQLGERLEDPLQMYLSDIYTIPASLAGLPAISIPCGLSSKGLPIGLQLMGRPFEENIVLRAAYAY